MLINGISRVQVSAFDRGFQFGDGLFETLAVRNSQPLLWSRHLDRLSLGAKKLGIKLPDPSVLWQESIEEINRLGCSNSVLKIIITRGESKRGYAAPTSCSVTRCISVTPAPSFPDSFLSTGIRLRFCLTQLSISPQLAGIKHLNRLEQVLGRSEWDDPNIAEGLMADPDGNIIEGTMSNLFMVKNKQLYTPDLARSGIAGIIRDLVLESAEELGIDVRKVNIMKQDLLNAQALFVTNSVIGLWPVASLEDTTYDVSLIDQRLIHQVRQHTLSPTNGLLS